MGIVVKNRVEKIEFKNNMSSLMVTITSMNTIPRAGSVSRYLITRPAVDVDGLPGSTRKRKGVRNPSCIMFQMEYLRF